MSNKMSSILRTTGAFVASILVAGQVMAEGPKISGYIDFGYSYNFNNPAAGPNGGNFERTFDGTDNSFTLHQAEVDFEGEADGFGYRVDLGFGNDAAAAQQIGTTVDGDKIDVQQAYITHPCPTFEKGSLTAGKFVTLLGREVIESADNMNYSRSYLFGYSIPFAHTGVKYDYAASDKLDVTVGLANGWLHTDDTNDGKAFLGGAGFTASDKLSFYLAAIYGPEGGDNLGRGAVTLLADYTVSDKLSLHANGVYGSQEAVTSVLNWAGAAFYVNYNFTDEVSGAVRYENFDDSDGANLSTGSNKATGGTMGGQIVNEFTVTVQQKKGNFIKRLELRQDTSNRFVFRDDKGASEDSQMTVGLEMIYTF